MSEAPERIEHLRACIAESARTIQWLDTQLARIDAIAEQVIAALKAGGKLLTAGNGGSAAEALHMAEELVGRYKSNRPSLPAISLAADSTALTCIGNDFGFDAVFSRQIEGLGNGGDMLLLFSTSGNGNNLRRALDAARAKDMKVICLLGRDGGDLAGRADLELIVEGTQTCHIQEAHQVVLHLVLEQVENAFPIA